MDARSGSFFENQLDSYRTRLGNIKAEQAIAWAKKVAEAENPLDALREAVAQIATPLGLDFLREGIMHYAGVASAQIGKKLEGLDPKFKEIFKDRLDDLVRLKKMSPEDRKKWIADEVQRRKQERLAQAKGKADELRTQAGDIASRTAGKARSALGGDNDDGGERRQPQPANDGGGEVDEANTDSAQGKSAREESALDGASANPAREPDRQAQPVDTSDVDDKGVSERASRLASLSPDDAVVEHGRLTGIVNEKAGQLTRVRKNAMNQASPELPTPDSPEDLARDIQVKNKIVNDALARQNKKRSRVTKYDEEGNPVTIRGRRLAQAQPRTAVEVERDAQQEAVNRSGQEPLGDLGEPQLVDAFSGEPVRPQANPAPKDDEPEDEPDVPEHVETLGGAKPPVDTRARVPVAPAPESIITGERYQSPRDQATFNPFSFKQASEQASRANLARLLPDVELPAVDLTGASARKPAPNNPRAVNPTIEDPALASLPSFKDLGIDTPQVSVVDRARALSEQLVPSRTAPQTAVRGGLGDVPALGLPQAPKAGVRPNRPEALASTPEVSSESVREAPFISAETGSRIGTNLGRATAVAGVLAPLAGQGTAQQKAQAVGEGAGVLAGTEALTSGARALGASEGLVEGAGLLPSAIATLAGQGTAGQKAQALGVQGAQVAGQKVAQKVVNKVTAPSEPTPKPSGSGAGAEGAEGAEAGAEAGEGLEGLEAGLLASGGETGGLGFLAAGLVGLGSALASIFAPHKKAPPAPPPVLPNLSIPVAQQGLS